ncbi:MAG: signal peptidase I [Erysipelotrichaceae bacterium]
MEEQNNNEQSSIGKELWEYVKVIGFSLLTVFLITNFLFKPIRVDGESMYPTLKNNQAGIANVLSVKLNHIERFDVVIAHEPTSNHFWVKRLIGLPNETIEYRDDVLYINGAKVEEPFLNSSYVQDYQTKGVFTEDFGPIQLQEDEYFLMGDNRPESSDSRYRGPFHKKDIIAKDVFVVYPLEEIGMISNGNK